MNVCIDIRLELSVCVFCHAATEWKLLHADKAGKTSSAVLVLDIFFCFSHNLLMLIQLCVNIVLLLPN